MHRDLKPENILITDSLHLKIVILFIIFYHFRLILGMQILLMLKMSKKRIPILLPLLIKMNLSKNKLKAKKEKVHL